MKKLLLIFSAFALIIVLSSFNFSSHEMVEVEEVQNNYSTLNGPGYWTQSYSSRYDSDKNEWRDWNQTYLPPKEIIKNLARMETVVFAY